MQPGLDAAGAGERGLLVDAARAQRQLDRPGRVAQDAEVAGRVGDRAAARRAARRRSSSSRWSQSGAPSWVRDAVDGSVAKPAPSRSQRNESTVPSRSVPRVARARHGVVVLEQPGRACRPRSRGRAASRCARGPRRRRPSASSRSSTSCERLSCQVTIGVSGRPVSASQASTDSPWWSRPQATTSPGGVARAARPPRPTTASQHLLRVLLDPARARVAERLLAPRLARRGRRSASNSDRLDRRGALVDAEQQAHRRARAPRCAATRARRRRRLGAVAAGARAPRPTPSPATISAHALGDPERRGQPGRADRGHVDQPLGTACERPDHVVDAAPGGPQPGVGGDRLGAFERRVHRDRLGHDLLARLGPHRPVVLVVAVDRGRPGDHLAVDGREHEHALGALRRHRQQDPLERSPSGGSKTRNSPLRG